MLGVPSVGAERLTTTYAAGVGGLGWPSHDEGAWSAADVPRSVIAAARRGDHAAFAVIVERHDDRLRALAFHLLQDREAMRDVLQDAYVKAYLGLPAFRGEADLGTWLYRIVYTTCLNHLRSASRRPCAADGDPARAIALSAASVDPVDDVHSALDLARRASWGWGTGGRCGSGSRRRRSSWAGRGRSTRDAARRYRSSAPVPAD